MSENTRGRGKFKPAPNLSQEEVKRVLMEKIEEEKTLIINSDKDEQLLRDLTYKNDKFNIVSLFSGCGGLDLGFELAGLSSVVGEEKALSAFNNREQYNELRKESVFHTIYTNDMFKEANESYRLNFPKDVIQHEKDIRRVANFPLCNLILGGFPCPGFSEAGPRLIDDERNFLYIQYIRALIQTQPEFFVAENVKGMLTLGKGEVIKQIVEDFASAGYKIKYKLVNSRDYGVPQLRERVFIVGVREDIDFEYDFPEPTHGIGEGLKPYITLRDAISDLEQNPGPYFTGSYSTIYLSRNRKKTWEDQSFTIQASGRQAPLHPGGEPMKKLDKNLWEFVGEQNRRLSIKEIARIQTFPDWFEFSLGNGNYKQENGRLDKGYKQIGNAVPVLLAKAIAKPIADYAVQQIQNGYQTIGDGFQTSLF